MSLVGCFLAVLSRIKLKICTNVACAILVDLWKFRVKPLRFGCAVYCRSSIVSDSDFSCRLALGSCAGDCGESGCLTLCALMGDSCGGFLVLWRVGLFHCATVFWPTEVDLGSCLLDLDIGTEEFWTAFLN